MNINERVDKVYKFSFFFYRCDCFGKCISININDDENDLLKKDENLKCLCFELNSKKSKTKIKIIFL